VPERLQLLVHPGLWGETDATFEERFRTHLDERFEDVETFLESQYVGDSPAR